MMVEGTYWHWRTKTLASQTHRADIQNVIRLRGGADERINFAAHILEEHAKCGMCKELTEFLTKVAKGEE